LIKTPTGSFLGTASGGGGNNFGSIFQVTPQGEVTRLVSFNGLNGLLPDGGLTLGNDGKYYGVTIGGGQGDRGTAFRVSAAGQFESLVNFSSISTPSPTGQMVQGSDGNFYGLCSDGVSNPMDPGAIFKLTPAKALSVAARFNDTGIVGKNPVGTLVEQADGTFLGVAALGGSNSKGVIFKFNTAGVISKIADFTGANGERPVGGLVKGADGNFYGITELGGTNSAGTIFKVTPTGDFSTVASFDFTNGHSPQGPLVESAGTFYGITKFGGANNEGAIFKITPGDATPAITKLADLESTVGVLSYAGLIFGDDGALYGTTSQSGGANAGTIIKVTTGGSLAKVADLGSALGQGSRRGVSRGTEQSPLSGCGIWRSERRRGAIANLDGRSGHQAR
jgi:uncharacterized repeat protein (TIGR03803 family)